VKELYSPILDESGRKKTQSTQASGRDFRVGIFQVCQAQTYRNSGIINEYGL
jgi:hypothetical protein